MVFPLQQIQQLNVYLGSAALAAFAATTIHLHIDLLPIAQGKGQGKLMMDHYITHLRNNHVTGVHLGLSIANNRAFNFYKKYGMHELERDEDSIFMGLHI